MKKLLTFIMLFVSLFTVLAVANTTEVEAAAADKRVVFVDTTDKNKGDGTNTVWFQAWVWDSNNNGEWITLTKLTNNIYFLEIPTNKTGMKILRKGSHQSGNNWDKWNETGDITINSSNKWTWTNGQWDGNKGSWGTYTPSSVRLVGGMNNWGIANSTNNMTNKNGVYTATYTLEAGTYEFKIAVNGSWDCAFSNSGAKMSESGSFGMYVSDTVNSKLTTTTGGVFTFKFTLATGELVIEKHVHEYVMKTNTTQHWKECSCGSKIEIADHSATESWVSSEDNHWKVCSTCNVELNKAAHKHTSTTVEPTLEADGSVTYTCECGHTYTETLSNSEVIVDELKKLVTEHYNEGVYVRNTEININDEAKAEMYEYFHNPGETNVWANLLAKRTTNFCGGYLYFNEGSKTAFGTNSNGIYSFTWKGTYNGLNENANVIDNYFVTLKDFADLVNTSSNAGKSNVKLDNGWTYAEGVYTSSDTEVIEAALAFTAPGWVGGDENYLHYTAVTITEDAKGNLVISVLVDTSDAEGKLLDVNNNVFSKAVVTKPSAE